MPSAQRSILVGLVNMLCVVCIASSVRAGPGQPVAVRWWGGGTVSIETFWNLTILIDPGGMQISGAEPEIDWDLVVTSKRSDNSTGANRRRGIPIVANPFDAEAGQSLNHVLDRMPDAPEPTWNSARAKVARSSNAVVVTSVPISRGAEAGSHAADVLLLIEVDGVRILYCDRLTRGALPTEIGTTLGRVDLMLIPLAGEANLDRKQAAHVVRQLKPRMVAPICYETASETDNLELVQPFLEALEEDYRVDRPIGNTLAICAGKPSEAQQLEIVLLREDPWKMPPELAALFTRKEAACRNSQQVFAGLSAGQMNFRPSNGTHTPRWNAEHMMGRELGFFSQIFSQLEPNVPHIDLNPKQMPKDYVAAHVDWSGQEEARQMERVNAFTRRFAYLLNGIDLDAKAPGSRWTLRGLLEQMDRHYTEHTQNVKQKFKLPDWPGE